jgi:hypothetical protein
VKLRFVYSGAFIAAVHVSNNVKVFSSNIHWRFKMIIKFIIALTIAASSIISYAATVPVDLSGWSPLTLDYPGGQPAGNWAVAGDNLSVTQTINADPSFFLNGLNQTQYSIDGSWQVLTASDDDYMGFVFGYQNSSNFYLFDWKQGTQGYMGTTAAEGMSIKKFTGGTGDGLTDLSLAELWENQVDFGDMDILASNHGSTKGWADYTSYDFHLDFGLNPNEISIIVKEGATELWNTTITDTTFSSGQFGFYNYSQSTVKYAGFEQTGGVIVDVPEPSIIALFVAGFFGLGFVQRRKHI